jgi:hypothetical protein
MAVLNEKQGCLKARWARNLKMKIARREDGIAFSEACERSGLPKAKASSEPTLEKKQPG